MVLPKDVREKANINSGDKMALVTCEMDGKVKVISLIRSEDFSEMVKGFLGPVMGDIFSK
jgi:bifunctional DNA-binding transcriptional regulator/antitoxin component of YhaV-PrlF toxin-antitoxin module